MKKRLLSLLLTLALCLSLLPTMAWAETDFTNGWTKIEAGTSTLSGGSKYYLTDNVTLTNNITVNGDVTLDLNGYVLTGNGHGSVISVNGNLTIEDSNQTATHYFKVGDNGLWTLTNETNNAVELANLNSRPDQNTIIKITGGCITGGNATNGGGVYVYGKKTLTMTGGNIVGNKAQTIASMITADGNGGGGGVFLTGNTSGNSGILHLSGTAKIIGNAVTLGRGGGVFAGSYSQVTMTGNAEIAYNYADDSNESIQHGGGGVMTNGFFTMTGGSIHHNVIVYGEGGGVYRYNSDRGSLVLGGDAKIIDNVKGDNGKSNLYVASDSTSNVLVTLGDGSTDKPKPTTDMKIGVSKVNGTGVFTTTATATNQNYLKYFTSDKDGLNVYRRGDNTLYLLTDWGALGNELAATTPQTMKKLDGSGEVKTLFNVSGTGATDNPYKITLENDFEAVTGDKTLTVSGDKTLDLKGHVLNGAGVLKNGDGTKTGSVITVSAGAELTLTDSGNTVRYYEKDETTGLWKLNTALTSGDCSTTGGVITGGTGTPNPNGTIINGGGVYVQEDGTLNMHGGNITGNTVKNTGGGVYVQEDGTLNMRGGNIVGNTAKTFGGGVAVAGEFTMSGDSKISYNNGQGAGGVYDNGDFKMIGGSIDHNTATGGGGGAFIAYTTGSTFTLGGSAKIIDNLKGEVEQNLYLQANAKITLGEGTEAPTNEMWVGVTTATPPTATKPVAITEENAEDYSARFFPDAGRLAQDVVSVKDSNNKHTLYLTKPAITVTSAESPVYGTASTAYTVTTSGFGTAPTLGIEWKSDSTWSTTPPTDVTFENDKVTTTTTTPVGSYVFRITNGETGDKLVTSDETTLTVGKATITPTVSITGWTYGKAANTPSVTGNTGEGAVTYTYKVKDTDDSTYTGTVPTNAGEYTVKAEIAETANYAAGSDTADFAIAKATPTADNFTFAAAENLIYDGQGKPATVTFNTKSDALTGMGVVTVKYAKKTGDATWGTATTEEPKDAGTYKVYVSVAEGDNYNATAEGGDLTAAAWTFTIGRADGSGSVTMDGWTYGETAKTPAPVSETNGTTSVTYLYKVKDAEDSTYTVTKPTNAGTYTVKATFAATVDYNEVTATADFTIAPKEVSVTAGAYKVSKVYDGKTDAGTASGALAVTGILDADTGVTVQPGTIPAYGGSDAKDDYSLTLPVSISGDTNGNYELTSATVAVPGEITRKDVTGATVGTFGDLTYTGSAQTPSATVTIDSLTATGTWSDVTSVADTTTFTASGNFTGTITGQTTGMNAATLTTATAAARDYTGSPLTPVLTVKAGDLDATYDLGNWNGELINAGTYTATVTGNGNFKGNVQVSFTINKIDPVASDFTVTLPTELTYDGQNKAATQTTAKGGMGTATIKYYLDGAEVTEAKNAGTYTVKLDIADGANYNAAKNLTAEGWTFTIAKATPTAANFTFTAPEHRAYDGQAKTATVVFNASTGLSGMGGVTVKYARKTGVDTWDAATSEKPKNAGTYKVSISVAEGTNYSAAAELTADSWTFDIYAVSSDPTVNVPVSGDKDSVKVQATVSGSNATVKNVTSEQLDKVGTGENVTVDLSGLSKSVSAVTLPKTTLENVAKSDADGLEVKLPNGTTAVFDSATVAAVAEQAAGSNIQLVVDKENKAEQALTAAQKETVKALNDALVLDAYFVSNGKRISDFKGGEAELTVSYPTTKPVRVWYVAEDGTKELVPSTFDGKAAKFVVTHFSHYAIEVLDGSSFANCPKDASCPIEKFTDTKNDFWWHDGIHYCLENGMMNGVAETLFAPTGTLTRGMVVTVLWRLENSPVVNYAMSFKDVPAGRWYTEAVRWAQSVKVVEGYDEASFGPNDNVTREQLAAILYRYALLKKVDVDEITKDTNTLSHNDVFTISDWATSGMHFCIAAGVVNGDDKGNLNPHSTATRAEAAAMFQRFCEKVVK